MAEQPGAHIPLTDVYVCGVMDDPTAPLPKQHWSPFAGQIADAAVGMPSMQGSGYSTLIVMDRVGIMYDRFPRLSFRTFYLEDCT